VHDNLLLGGYTRRREAEHIETTLATVYEHFPRLLERRDQLAGTLSGGEQQMLAIGRALMSGPRVMLLDEPSLGLAPQMTERIMRILGDLRHATGLSIVLVEQNARAALDLADRGYLLSGGRVVLEGSSADLKQDRTIQQIYLGGTASAPAS
jgi:branched-chain amino acid transport system ATP-binding protein